MSTSLLYHAFGIRGYQYVRTDYRGGEVIFTISQNLKTCRCSACGAHEVQSRGGAERRFRRCPSAAGRPRLSCPSRACSVWSVESCGRLRSLLPIRDAATPDPLNATRWNCPAA